MNDSKTVACLAGDGVGPELMAAATRALDRVARLHSLELEELHLPFAGEAVTRSGHALPAATRAGYRDVDAILVSSPREPALDGVKADLQLSWHVARVHRGGEQPDIVVFAPLDAAASGVAVERAFSCAASRHGRVAVVGEDGEWLGAVEAEQGRWAGMETERIGLGEALVRLSSRPEELDVILTEAQLMDALVEACAHFADSHASVAHGWLPESGPGVFAPGSCEPDDEGGFGVADPTGMLLTASLLLGEGLKRRSASRTLERAVGEVAGRSSSAPRETRTFTDAVIDLLPEKRTDLEHFEGAWR
jgi:3-isopropylmalate dehydrogenase